MVQLLPMLLQLMPPLLLLLPECCSAVGSTYRVQMDIALWPGKSGRQSVLLELDRRFAPLAADRFHELVEDGFYDGVAFHRVVSGCAATTRPLCICSTQRERGGGRGCPMTRLNCVRLGAPCVSTCSLLSPPPECSAAYMYQDDRSVRDQHGSGGRGSVEGP